MTCLTYAAFLVTLVLIGLTAWPSGGRNVQELSDKLLRLIKYHPGFSNKFDPFDLSPFLSNETDANCLKYLHGLSNMRMLEVDLDESDQDSTKFVIDFEYPKLCLKCKDLSTFTTLLRKMRIVELPSFQLKDLYDVCAEYTQGEIKLEVPQNDTLPPKVEQILLYGIRFHPENTDQIEEIPPSERPRLNKLRRCLPFMGEVVRRIVSDVIGESIGQYMVEVYQEAGNCSTGDCSVLEFYSDFEVMGMFTEALQEVPSRLADLVKLYHVFTFFTKGDRYIVQITDLEGMSTFEVISYETLKQRGRSSYKMNLFLEYGKLCIKGNVSYDNRMDDIESTPYSELLWMCGRNMKTVVTLNVLGDPEDPLKIESVHVQNFRLQPKDNTSSAIPLRTLYQEIGSPLKEQIKLNFQHVLRTGGRLFDVKPCDPGTCFKNASI